MYEQWLAAGRGYDYLKYGEAWTALTFLWMAARQVDWGVIETGMGGRYSPTNTLPSSLAVITNIGLDHIKSLGPELTDIAHHKAGIIKPGGIAITGATQPEVLAVIRQEARQQRARLYAPGDGFAWQVQQVDQTGAVFDVQTPFRSYQGVRIGTPGVFQAGNAALALAAIDILAEEHRFPLSTETIAAAYNELIFPGRMEIMQTAPPVILDGAHNPQKMEALASSLRAMYPGRRVIAICGMLSTKDVNATLAHLLPLLSGLIATQPHVFGKRPVLPATLAEAIREMAPKLPVQIAGDARRALGLALSQAGPDDLILVTGSLYLVGEAREHWVASDALLARLEGLV